ncbi:MAG: hypothetical protein PHG66_03985 [Candidatus Colwellbacteria bacterium]|nr:hypothetical protein [Candidatus Colwellbacteria bacterium]
MAIIGLRESLTAHKDAVREYSLKINDIERDIRRAAYGEVVAAVGKFNGAKDDIAVLEYKMDICDGILVTITRAFRKGVPAHLPKRKLTEKEADEACVFLMDEISSRLGISPNFHVLVQIESCLIADR